MTTLLLTRHAQSEWNALGRWQGRADPPLSQLGRVQASQAAEKLGHVDAIISSPLERARHTAEIIAEALGVGPISIEPDLAERDVGEWSGLTNAEIEISWPGFLEQRRRPPSYESDDALLRRTLEALDRTVNAFRDAQVLVIAHGGLIYALEAYHGESFQRIPNLGGRWLFHKNGQITLGDRILLAE